MTTIFPNIDLIVAKKRLLEIVKAKAYKEGDFTLASGRKSDFYLDCRLVTLDPEGLTLFSRLICAELADDQVVAVGGLVMSAIPISAGVSVISHQLGRPLRAFLVRKEAKEHGTGRQIEGELAAGERVAVVDDTMTSGMSVKQAIAAVEKAGAKVVKVICLADRKEGGSDDIRKMGYEFRAIFEIADIRKK